MATAAAATSRTAADDRWTIAVTAADSPGEAWLYERATKGLTRLYITRPELEGQPLAQNANRLVQALEAQFPDQEFEEMRHPRVETTDDLELAVAKARGRPAVVVYTLVQGPTLPWLARKLRLGDTDGAADLGIESAPLEQLRGHLLSVAIPEGSRLNGVEINELRLPTGA